MNYKYGSRDTEKDKGVAELQQKLKDKGYNIAVDGIYGTETRKAVTQYQAKNKLKVDGIAGNETLTSLGIASKAPVKPQTTTTATQPTTAQTANQKLTQLATGTSSNLNDAINILYDRVINQKPFEYEPSADPTYNRYADTYARNAKLMSEDAMAQAAQLTGGYGSSYGQAVATQAYNAEMSKMNDIIPELRQNAYNEWDDQRRRDVEALTMLLKEREYQRDIFEKERDYIDKRNDLRYEKKQAAQDKLDRREELALSAGFKSWDEYVKAVGDGNVGNETVDFEQGFLDGAVAAFESKGEEGLMTYFDVYGNKYGEDQLSWLGESIVNGYQAPQNNGTYPEGVPKIGTILDAEKYLTEIVGELSGDDEEFLEELLSYSEMKKDGVDDKNDTPEAYSRYLTWKLYEYLQDRKYDN